MGGFNTEIGATLKASHEVSQSVNWLIRHFDSQYFSVVRVKIWRCFFIVHPNHMSLLFRFSLSL